jgi:inorganic pyrophosphatase
LWEDNDPLDIIVLSTFPLQSGLLVRVRPIGVMEMIDAGESDYKVLTVPSADRRWEDTSDLTDLNKHLVREIQHFFETYKNLKGKPAVVDIKGFKGKADAIAAIEKSAKLYKEKFQK